MSNDRQELDFYKKDSIELTGELSPLSEYFENGDASQSISIPVNLSDLFSNPIQFMSNFYVQKFAGVNVFFMEELGKIHALYKAGNKIDADNALAEFRNGRILEKAYYNETIQRASTGTINETTKKSLQHIKEVLDDYEAVSTVSDIELLFFFERVRDKINNISNEFGILLALKKENQLEPQPPHFDNIKAILAEVDKEILAFRNEYYKDTTPHLQSRFDAVANVAIVFRSAVHLDMGLHNFGTALKQGFYNKNSDALLQKYALNNLRKAKEYRERHPKKEEVMSDTAYSELLSKFKFCLALKIEDLTKKSKLPGFSEEKQKELDLAKEEREKIKEELKHINFSPEEKIDWWFMESAVFVAVQQFPKAINEYNKINQSIPQIQDPTSRFLLSARSNGYLCNANIETILRDLKPDVGIAFQNKMDSLIQEADDNNNLAMINLRNALLRSDIRELGNPEAAFSALRIIEFNQLRLSKIYMTRAENAPFYTMEDRYMVNAKAFEKNTQLTTIHAEQLRILGDLRLQTVSGRQLPYSNPEDAAYAQSQADLANKGMQKIEEKKAAAAVKKEKQTVIMSKQERAALKIQKSILSDENNKQEQRDAKDLARLKKITQEHYVREEEKAKKLAEESKKNELEEKSEKEAEQQEQLSKLDEIQKILIENANLLHPDDKIKHFTEKYNAAIANGDFLSASIAMLSVAEERIILAGKALRNRDENALSSRPVYKIKKALTIYKDILLNVDDAICAAHKLILAKRNNLDLPVSIEEIKQLSDGISIVSLNVKETSDGLSKQLAGQEKRIAALKARGKEVRAKVGETVWCSNKGNISGEALEVLTYELAKYEAGKLVEKCKVSEECSKDIVKASVGANSLKQYKGNKVVALLSSQEEIVTEQDKPKGVTIADSLYQKDVERFGLRKDSASEQIRK
jgi:hypothetical protein